MICCLARVDDRLIHGQVLHGWVPRLNIATLIVADASLSEDPEEQEIARLAVPPDVDVHFVAPGRVAETIDNGTDDRVLVLFRSPIEALEAVVNAFQPKSLNLGNSHFEPGKIQLRKTFCCSNKEMSALRDIAASGVAIDYQPAPDLKRIPIDAAVF